MSKEIDTAKKPPPSPAPPARNLNRELIAATIANLLIHYPTPGLTTAERSAIAADWLTDLAEFPASAVQAASQEWRRTQNRRPTPAEMRKLAREATPKPSATLGSTTDFALAAKLAALRAQGFTVSTVEEYRAHAAAQRDRVQRASLARAAHAAEIANAPAKSAPERTWHHLGFSPPVPKPEPDVSRDGSEFKQAEPNETCDDEYADIPD